MYLVASTVKDGDDDNNRVGNQSPFHFRLLCSHVSLRRILESDGHFHNAKELSARLQTNPKRVYEAINVLAELNLVEARHYRESYVYLGRDRIHSQVFLLTSLSRTHAKLIYHVEFDFKAILAPE